MTMAHDLESARAALEMINPGPVQRRGTARGPGGRHHPHWLHYVRSNFALPEHDGTLRSAVPWATPRP